MNRRDLEITKQEDFRYVLEHCHSINVGMHDGEDIYILPMNYGYVLEEDKKLTFYIHSGKRGKKLELLRANGRISFEMDCDHQLIEGEKPCQYGYAYVSMMGKGNAVIVEDVQEKQKALSILMSCLTGKEFEFTEKLTTIVEIIRIDVEEYTGKRRLAKRF